MEENLTQGHKGTKDTTFRKDRTKVQKRVMANPLLSRTRTFTCTCPQGGAEGNSTQRHKGTKDTKFRKDRTKVQNRGMANPLLSRTRTFTCTCPQGGGEGNSTQRHKGHKVQRVIWLLGAGTRTAACSVSTELSPKHPL